MQSGKLERVWIYGDSLSTGTHGDGAYLEALKGNSILGSFTILR